MIQQMKCPFCNSKLCQQTSFSNNEFLFCGQCVEYDATGQVTERLFIIKKYGNVITGFRITIDNCKIDNDFLQGNRFVITTVNRNSEYINILAMEKVDNLDPFNLDALRAMLKTALVFQ